MTNTFLFQKNTHYQAWCHRRCNPFYTPGGKIPQALSRMPHYLAYSFFRCIAYRRNQPNLYFRFPFVLQNKNSRFDIAINLDKDPEAIALLAEVSASEKYGFILNNNHLDAATPAAQHKIVTGLFDGVSKENTKSYLEEIFEICHLIFRVSLTCLITTRSMLKNGKC